MCFLCGPERHFKLICFFIIISTSFNARRIERSKNMFFWTHWTKFLFIEGFQITLAYLPIYVFRFLNFLFYACKNLSFCWLYALQEAVFTLGVGEAPMALSPKMDTLLEDSWFVLSFRISCFFFF